VLAVPFVVCGCAALSGRRVDLAILLISLALPVTAAIWLAYFRLRVDQSGIEYRDLFGKNFRVAYSEIESLRTQTLAAGGRNYQMWILHLHDGRRLRINLKPLPRDVHVLLLKRLQSNA